ncbi:hypothetical protein FHS84_003850 [Rhizomicrobium electricum]|nr:hypothetical protein [Rhizomicrobium electricum]
MAKNKKRRQSPKGSHRPRRPQQSPSPLQKQSLTDIQESFWLRIQKHPLGWLLGSIATLTTLCGFVWQALIGPDIDVPIAESVSPFAAPIAVSNRSYMFEMSETHILCGLGTVSLTNRKRGNPHSVTAVITGIQLQFAKAIENIAPSDVGNFQCSAIGIGEGGISEANIFVTVEYRTLGFKRTSRTQEITWCKSCAPPRWVKGQFPHQITEW